MQTTGIYKPNTRKRYTIRYLPATDHDPASWGIYDHGTHGFGNDVHGLIEGGYDKDRAIRAANFYNYHHDKTGREA